MKNYIIKIVQFVVVAVLIFVGFKFLTKDKPPEEVEETNNAEVVVEEKFISEIEYINTTYGFSFYLPETWKGYVVIEDEWEGYSLGTQSSGGQVVTETGPFITLRHPDWEYKSPKQDMPIMVLTLMQWRNLSEDKFHIGAAPIGPTELGRNSRYVFALPARYNYSFSDGYEEVEELLKKNPLQTF